MMTEQQLITVKANWAHAEHEREQHYNQALEFSEKITELEQALVKAHQEGKRGRRPVSITTTKTSSTS